MAGAQDESICVRICNYMNRVDQSLRVLFGAVLLASAASSVAMSLGRMRGAAIVGRPLDVTVTAQLGESAGIADACVAADVFFGDSQLARGRVSLITSMGANPGEALIRITTTFSVDEPVVTVYVREGCGQQITRKYVLLAELLSDNVESPLISAEAVPAATSPARTGGQPGDRTGGQGNAVSQAQTNASPGQARRGDFSPRTGASNGSSAKVASTPPAVRAVPNARTAAVARPSGARLKLDPIDLKEPERQPVLRSSGELLTVPAADPQQRAAAAGLWQALNAPPEEMMRDAARLKTLEDQMASIVAQNRSIEKAVTELGAELKEARSQRYNNWLVYLLGALLSLAVFGLAFLLRGRQRSESNSETWWRKGDGSDGDASRQPLDWNSMDQVFQQSALMQGSDSGERVPAAGSAKPLAAGDQSAGAVSAAPREALRSSRQFGSLSPQGSRSSEFSPSLSGMSINIPRAVNAEELFDVQQQADFFLSLGDSAKAVEVLRQHIGENAETSALAYLDLFEIYHKLGRRDDYELLRSDFNRIFNAQVPTFDDYAADANGLEFYASALSRIESLWPNSKVLDVLEESIFRKPDSGSEVFSIAAYRELLLLHAIAKNVVNRSNGHPDTLPAGLPELPVIEGAQDDVPAANKFRRTKMEALPAGMSLPVADLDLTNPRPSSRLGLDIDLNQFPGEEATAALPEIALSQAASLPETVMAKAQPVIEPPPVDTSLLEFNLDKLDPWRLR